MILIHDENYDDGNTPNTSRVDETTSTLLVFGGLSSRDGVKRDKPAALYRHSNVTGNINLINLSKFKYENTSKKDSPF